MFSRPASLLKKRLNSFMGVCLSTSSSTKSKMSSNNLQEFSANLSVDDLEPEKPVEVKLGKIISIKLLFHCIDDWPDCIPLLFIRG